MGLPQGHAEADLHIGLLHHLKDFLIELGRDFCFVGSQFPLQVGGLDLHVGNGSRLWAPKRLTIGNCVYIGKQVHIEANCIKTLFQSEAV